MCGIRVDRNIDKMTSNYIVDPKVDKSMTYKVDKSRTYASTEKNFAKLFLN